MRAWITASLLVTSTLIWLKCEAFPQVFQNNPQESAFDDYKYQLEIQPSHLNFLHFPIETNHQILSTPRTTVFTQNNALESAFPIYTKFEQNFDKNLDDFAKPKQIKPTETSVASDRNDGLIAKPYVDHTVSQSAYHIGPHQIETIESENFHQKVPALDISGFQQHQTGEKHGEVHYHQHTHVHKHEHKQEHIHEHKQNHQHKHLHNQQHKHEHHSDHKHGHEHKHDHHHDHKHDNHHEHKHNHNHGHKHQAQHQHHSQHKHQHGHKHQGKHEHNHKHHSHWKHH